MTAFASESEHRDWLKSQSALPRGFRVGTCSFKFDSVELKKPAAMTLTLIELDQPSDIFSCLFTSNAFPGAPITVGREVSAAGKIRAILVNNKISNVCAPGGVEDCRAIVTALASELGCEPSEVLPSSTGVIGWKLPVATMIDHLPEVREALQAETIFPAAEGIVTTDLYPKVRSRNVGAARIVGIAKGAGMIEPNLATMLVYILTDAAIEKAELDALFREAVSSSFNRITVDSDQSTSDTAVCLSSGAAGPVDHAVFRESLIELCEELARDLVRNGEGVKHVVQVAVHQAPTEEAAHQLAKNVANSPLVQTAICGNDPNVGRLLMALGKNLDSICPGYDHRQCEIRLGGKTVLENGVCVVNQNLENALVAYLKETQLYETQPPDEHGKFHPPVSWPRHEKQVEIDVFLHHGASSAVVWGSDRTHEYITENADYRS